MAFSMRKHSERISGPGTFVGAVGNALHIMRHLAHAAQPEGAAQIARTTRINTSTCFNILRTLVAEGVVEFSDENKTYRLSMGILEFALPVLGTNPLDLIRPDLSRISREYDILIALWNITAHERMVLIDRMIESRIVHIDISIGSRLPSFVGAVGRCVAASRDLSEHELERKYQELRWANPPGFEAYLADVQRAGELGYAFDHSNLYNVIDIVGAVVCDASGDARFGISAIGIAGQKSPEELRKIGEALKATSNRIAKNLLGAAGYIRKEISSPG